MDNRAGRLRKDGGHQPFVSTAVRLLQRGPLAVRVLHADAAGRSLELVFPVSRSWCEVTLRLGSWFPCRLFLGPGFRLGARWNRLVETVKTHKKRGKTGKKWARYGLRSVKDGS